MKQLGLIFEGGQHRVSPVRKTMAPKKCWTYHGKLEPKERAFDGNCHFSTPVKTLSELGILSAIA